MAEIRQLKDRRGTNIYPLTHKDAVIGLEAGQVITKETIEQWGFYEKPSEGVPKIDLASGVQNSLGKADSAYQKPSTGIPSTDLSQSVQQTLAKVEEIYQDYIDANNLI